MKIEKLPFLCLDSLSVLFPAFDGFAGYFKSAIESGECELWSIDNGTSYCITRMELHPVTTLVFCCYAGSRIRRFARYASDLCERNNWAIRVHTKDARLAKLYQKHFGFSNPEYVLTRGAKDGR